ncbi:MAG: proton-conducting transporter membrane subunit [Caldilineales bacterium]
MSGVVLIFTLPLLAAVLVYLLRRWPLPSALLAGVSALALGLLLWRWPNDQSVLFLGRVIVVNRPVILFGQTFAMQPSAQWVLGMLSLTLVGVYLGAWRISQGRTFFPFGLGLLTLFGAALTLQSAWNAPILLAALVAVGAFVVQAGRQGTTRGATRLLWLPVLVIPLFLLASWFAGQAALDAENGQLLQQAGQLASFGLLILLAPWPLHGSAVSLGEEAPPLVAAWLLAALSAAAITLLQSLLVQYEWLQSATLFYTLPALRLGELLLYGGMATCLWAGMAAAVQNTLSRLWSYAALFAYGTVLISIGLGARGSWALVWLLMFARTTGLVASAFGLAAIRQRAGGSTSFEAVQGVGTRLPWTTAVYLIGLLSLAGMPLTAGFAGQWALLQALGSQDWLQAVVVLAGALGLIVGLIRALSALLGPLRNLLLQREERLMVWLAGVALLAVLLPALLPTVWLRPLSAAVAAFSAGSGL